MGEWRLSVPSGSGDPSDIDWSAAQGHFLGERIHRVGLSGFEPVTTAYLLAAWELTGSGSAFFDVGANVGVYSLLAARLFPGKPTFAIEPVPQTAETIRTLAHLNALDVSVEEWAASNVDAEGTLHIGDRDNVSSLREGWRPSSSSVTVPLRRIDSAIAAGLPTPGVVKIDVETHEPEVLEGMTRALGPRGPVVVIELLRNMGSDTRKLMPSSARARDILRDHGYEPFRIPARELALPTPDRDWVWWPDGIPADYDACCRSWLARVLACTGAGNV